MPKMQCGNVNFIYVSANIHVTILQCVSKQKSAVDIEGISIEDLAQFNYVDFATYIPVDVTTFFGQADPPIGHPTVTVPVSEGTCDI